MSQNATASTTTTKKATTKKAATKKATKSAVQAQEANELQVLVMFPDLPDCDHNFAAAVEKPVELPDANRKLILLSNTFLEQQRALYKQYKAKREAAKKPLTKDEVAKYAENVKRIATYIVAGKHPHMLWPSDKLDSFSELIVVLAPDSKKGIRRVRYGVC